jgi:hypothetical protein
VSRDYRLYTELPTILESPRSFWNNHLGKTEQGTQVRRLIWHRQCPRSWAISTHFSYNSMILAVPNMS